MVECALDPQLSQLLSAHRVQVMQPRSHMVQLRAVPTGPGLNKACSNVLLRKRTTKDDWEVFVDEDLSYSGDNADQARLFAGARQRRWLALTPPVPLPADINDAIRLVLGWLESPMCDSFAAGPSAPPTGGLQLDPLLERCAQFLGLGELAGLPQEATAAQSDAVLHVAEVVTRGRAPTCPLLWGPAGGGKTRIARWAAAKLVRHGHATKVLEVRGAALCAGAMIWPERDERLRHLVDSVLASQNTLVLLEEADLAVVKSEIAHAILADGLDRGLKVIAVARAEFAPQWVTGGNSLERRLEMVLAPEPEGQEMRHILQRHADGHPLSKRCQLAPEVVPAVLALAGKRSGANPGAALGLLEAVLNRAAWTARPCIGPDDVYHLVSAVEAVN